MTEFERRLPLKHLFVFHGNVRDLAWLNSSDAPNQGAYLPLPQWLLELLPTWGYEVVGLYDLVDGLRFGEEPEAIVREQKFRELADLTDPKIKLQAALKIQPGSPRAEDDLLPPSKILKSFRKALKQGKTACAFIIDWALLLSQRPDELTEPEQQIFLQIMKCASDATVVPGPPRNNLLILLTPKLNDLPPWLVIDNPKLQAISIPVPDEAQRHRFFEAAMPKDDAGSMSPASLKQLAHLTHGLSLEELEVIVNLSNPARTEESLVSDPQKLVQQFKFGVTQSPWEDKYIREKLGNAEKHLQDDVKGQPAAVRAVSDILKRAALGLSGVLHSSKSSKPRGILFFAGPTGVGKTEMAKSLARLLFGDEAACLRFDMSEYSQEHSDQRLFGAPPGYVGYEAGGQLTSEVKKNPFSVLLFDEIEKAHPSILDKFLQILEDGRLTSGQGETVFFSECILIFTSNQGMYEEVDVPDGAGRMRKRKQLRPQLAGEDVTYEQLHDEVMKGLEEFFNDKLGRPELRNRIGNNFVIFDFIPKEVVREILQKQLAQIKTVLHGRRENWACDFSAVEDCLLQLVSRDLKIFGGRGIGNNLETALVNPLARRLFDEQPKARAVIAVTRIEEVEPLGSRNYRVDWVIQ